MEFSYNQELYFINNEYLNELLWDIHYQYTRGYELDMNRYDVICDIPELQSYLIEYFCKEIPNTIVFNISKCESFQDYLLKKEELLKQGHIIISIKADILIEKLAKKDNNINTHNKFYNHTLNFFRDYYRNNNIKYREIMFFSNKEYRIYIQNALDTASMSNFACFNKAIINKKDNKTLDDYLEEEYNPIPPNFNL